MKSIEKIAVIGGTGKSGKYLVKELLAQGFHVRLLLRDPGKLQTISPQAEVIKGDARDPASVLSLIEGCAAVISTLGQPRGESPVFSQATRNVIKAMDSFQIDRYILTTGLNVNALSDRKSAGTLAATEWMMTHYPDTTKDKQTEYNVLSESHVNWTLVRLPLIMQTDDRRQVKVSLEDCPGDQISATDLAHFLITQLTDKQYVRKAPFIANV